MFVLNGISLSFRHHRRYRRRRRRFIVVVAVVVFVLVNYKVVPLSTSIHP